MSEIVNLDCVCGSHRDQQATATPSGGVWFWCLVCGRVTMFRPLVPNIITTGTFGPYRQGSA